ncbi:hypothetical protein TNCV_3812111 [Trichonephila clavipes]|nr:hypothetical protein TNCV_3812111 [Trichonephila clavipes]
MDKSSENAGQFTFPRRVFKRFSEVLWRDSPLFGKYPSTLKHISYQEYDIMEEYRSDDERYLALQSPTDR